MHSIPKCTLKNRSCSIQHIMESVDSVGRDGPDMVIYVVHYKRLNVSEDVES